MLYKQRTKRQSLPKGKSKYKAREWVARNRWGRRRQWDHTSHRNKRTSVHWVPNSYLAFGLGWVNLAWFLWKGQGICVTIKLHLRAEHRITFAATGREQGRRQEDALLQTWRVCDWCQHRELTTGPWKKSKLIVLERGWGKPDRGLSNQSSRG